MRQLNDLSLFSGRSGISCLRYKGPLCWEPVQLIANVYLKIFVVVHCVHIDPKYWDRDHKRFGLLHTHHHLPGLCHIELHVVELTLVTESLMTALHSDSSRPLIHPTITETSQTFGKTTGLWPIGEVCGAEGKEVERKDSSLRCTSVADHHVWHKALPSYILWSASRIVNNPGHQGGSKLHLSHLMVSKTLEK